MNIERAVKRGKIDEIQRNLNQGVSPNKQNKAGTTLLMHACKKRQYNSALCLLDSGADVNVTKGDGTTALWHAVNNNDLDLVQLLLQYNSDFDYEDKSGYMHMKLIYICLNNENYELLEFLLKKGYCYRRNGEIRTYLAWIAIRFSIKAIKLLERYGMTDFSFRNESGCSLLTACGGNKEIFDYLISHGADILNIDNSGANILHYISYFSTQNLEEIIDYAVSKGCDINLKEYRGFTPLMMVCGLFGLGRFIKEEKKAQDQQKALMLLKHKPDIFVKSVKNANHSALENAAECGYLEVIKVMFQQYDIDRASVFSVLDHAACYGNLEIVQLVIDNYADVNIVDERGNALLMKLNQYAGTAEQQIVKKWLREKMDSLKQS